MITLRSAVGLALFLSCGGRVYALDTKLDLSQYVHTVWKARDGLIRGTIRSIAQTQDGYLWLGTDLGLLRFDGVRAVAWQPPAGTSLPSSAIKSLLAARDGTLWIGTNQGLVSWRDGHLTQHNALAASYISTLLEDRDGSIWLARYFNRWTLCRIQNTRVTCFGEDGGAGDGVVGVYEDRMGQLWAGTANGLWKWRPGTPTFSPLPAENNWYRAFSEAADGSLLIARAGGIRRFTEGRLLMQHAFQSSMQSAQPNHLLRDRDGGLWVGTSSRGLIHVHDGITDVFSQTAGLSGDSIQALFEDREGNVWVATGEGLDRFRAAGVVPYSRNQGLSNSVALSVLTSGDGSLWIATSDGLNRWINAEMTVYRDRRSLAANGDAVFSSRKVREITGSGLPAISNSIFEDSQGRLWVSTAGGVGYLANDKFVRVRGVPLGVTRAIAEDRRKTLWIAHLQAGLFRLAPGTIDVDRVPWSVLQHEDPVSAMVADRSEGLWFGFFRGGITYFAGGQVRVTRSSSDGLADGRVSALYADRAGGIWIAADGGLSYLKDGRVATLTGRNGLPCDAVGWVIDDDDRALWLGMACGLVRIARADIDAWLAAAGAGDRDDDAARPIRTTVFDHADGVRMHVDFSYYTAPVTRAADGKLWFMSQDGVSVVDPRRLPFNRLPPPVHVEQVIADRRTYAADGAANGRLNLPALTRDLQIDYTALSFVAPDKVRFRYMLEGYDSEWQDAGNRRQAFYTNLPPRHYRFRVTASNNSGVWNEAGAFLDLSVAPAYYQTAWFKALSIGAVIALVWGGHRLRLRIVEKHRNEISALNERTMKAQEQERIRIAGELHDGVMQDMLAVTMMLGTLKRRVREDPAATATLDRAQQKLVQAGTDLRQLSHDLHPPLLQEAGLPKAVTAYCEQFSEASNIPVRCDAAEDVRDLSRGAALALFRIVQEALGNAAKHASARQITVHLARSDGMVSLTVSDDGVGLDPGRFASAGGLGLVMMRERATQLNGRFDFESVPGRGTTIRVVVPFR